MDDEQIRTRIEQLVSGVLDDIRARGLEVVPLCPFAAAYIRRHPEYADLVEDDASTGP